MASLIYPLRPLFNVIIRIERYEKPGCSTIDLLHDAHLGWNPEHELAITEGLIREKSEVLVEDMTEHVGSPSIKKGLIEFHNAVPGSLLGLTSRLTEVGLLASNVECRSGFIHSSSNTNEEISKDFKNIVEGLKVANPRDPLAQLSNEIINKAQSRSKAALAYFEKDMILHANFDCITRDRRSWFRENVIGDEIVDMIALTQLCKKDEANKHKALVAGSMHCSNVALCLEKLGYKRIKCLEDTEKKGRVISASYQSLIPNSTDASLYILDSWPVDGASESFSLKALDLDQIQRYFTD